MRRDETVSILREMLPKDDGIHGTPVIPLRLLHESLEGILIGVGLSSECLHPVALRLVDETEPLSGHLGHVVVELYEVVGVQPREVRLRDALAVTTGVLQITAQENPWY
jgi:hypothetical protein